MEGVIYKATNQINGKIYVGKTTTKLKIRMANHISNSLNLNFYLRR